MFLSTGWAMRALNRLIDFRAGREASRRTIVGMLVAAGVLTAVAIRFLQFV